MSESHEESQLRLAKIRQLFHVYDADRNGILEKTDFQAVVDRFARARNLDPGAEAYQSLQTTYLSVWSNLKREADEDGDGQVTFEEMHSYHDTITHDPLLFHQQVVSLTDSLFQLLDSDDDGQIVESEYLDFASCLGFEADSDLFRHLSPRGEMDKKTLRERLSEFYFSEQPESRGNWFFGRIEELE